jgi:hypothetical protein
VVSSGALVFLVVLHLLRLDQVVRDLGVGVNISANSLGDVNFPLVGIEFLFVVVKRFNLQREAFLDKSWLDLLLNKDVVRTDGRVLEWQVLVWLTACLFQVAVLLFLRIRYFFPRFHFIFFLVFGTNHVFCRKCHWFLSFKLDWRVRFVPSSGGLVFI